MLKSFLKLTVLVGAASAAWTGTAVAGFGYVGSGAFGALGSGPAEFVDPGDAVVHEATGRVFVADSGNARVQVFEPGGGAASFLTEVRGPLDYPVGVAVDQRTGALYVSDSGTNRIYRFTNDGAPLPTFSLDAGFNSPLGGRGDGRIGSYDAALAVDPIDGDLLVADRSNQRISRYDGMGAFESSIVGADVPDGPLAGPIDVAVDAAGRVHVVDATGDIVEGGGSSRALLFNPDGSYDARFDGVATPGAVAVDPHTGYALIAGNVNAFGGVRIHAFDGIVPVDDVPLPGDNTGTAVGLAAAGGSSPQVYVVGDRVFGCCGFTGVQVLQAVELPEPTIVQPVDVTARTAQLRGAVDPNGRQTSWQFELSTDGGGTWEPAGEPGDAGSGTAPVAVETEARGLLPNTEYNARLVVRAAGELDARSSGAVFTTDAAAPDVATSGPNPAGETSVVVGGVVNPNGTPTTYWIEYGTSTAYGASAPRGRDGGAGASNDPGFVSETLVGLAPHTQYHYRLVARNTAGETVGADRTFTTGTAPASPRHLEMVTPSDKGRADVGSRTSTIHASPDGDRVAFMSAVPFPGAVGSGAGNDYIAERAAGGWSTSHLTPPQGSNSTAAQTGATFSAYAEDLSAGVLKANDPPLTAGAATGEFAQNLYRRRFSDPAGTYTLLTPTLDGPFSSSDQLAPTFAAASIDLSRVFFETTSTMGLTPDAPDDLQTQAYVFGPRASLRYLGRLPGGATSTDGVSVGRGVGSYVDGLRAVASDGSRAVLTTGAGTGTAHIYLWRAGEEPLDVSRSRRTNPDPAGPGADQFMIASTDQRKVFFASSEKLTDDATASGNGSDLYLYDADTDNLTDLTTANPDGAGVVDVLGASDDGSRIYFVATGSLAAGATAGRRNLYTWSTTGGLRFVALLEPETAGETHSNVDWGIVPHRKSSRVSRDGNTLLFTSSLRQTGYDNAGRREIYLYDASAGVISCASCRPDGRPPVSDAAVTVSPRPAQQPRQYLPRFLSDDGEHAFFYTADDLVRDDVNGTLDVYEYFAGRVRLVTNGRAVAPARFADATPDGKDVFFTTRERLSGWDTDDVLDLYVARTDGQAFPEPPPRPDDRPCEGSDCQGAPRDRPAEPTPRSLDAPEPRGDGAAACAGARVLWASTSAAQRRAAARSGRLTMSVRHRADGTVAVSATAAIGPKRAARTVGSTRARVSGGQIRTVRLKLSSLARKRLVQAGRLALTVRVTFSAPCGGRKTLRLTLTRSAVTKRGSAPRTSTRRAG